MELIIKLKEYNNKILRGYIVARVTQFQRITLIHRESGLSEDSEMYVFDTLLDFIQSDVRVIIEDYDVSLFDEM